MVSKTEHVDGVVVHADEERLPACTGRKAWPAARSWIPSTPPAPRPSTWTAAADGPACYAYYDNYLIDLEHAVIVDVEATMAVRQAEVGAAQTMLTRTAERLGLCPERLIADTGYGSAAMLA